MSHQWEFPQSNAEQEITVAYEDPAFPDFPLYESYMQCFPNEQLSQLDFAVNAGSTAWEWPENADLAPHQSAGQEVCLLESIVEGQNVLIEPSSEEQGLKHVVSELGDRVNKLEEGMEHRVNRFEEGMEQRMAKVEQIVENLQIGLEEEKTRLCNEIDAQIEKLQAWAVLIKNLVDRVTESN